MRPHTLLMAKLSWLILLLGGFAQSLHAPVTPVAGLLSAIPGGIAWLAATFWIGGFLLLCNRGVRGACVAAGAAALLAPFESLAAWHPYAWVAGGVLLLCALQGPGDDPRFVRWFIILVHAAAALGAANGAGWVHTALAPTWSEPDFVGTIPRWFDRVWPTDVLARALQWTTVVVCALIPVGLLIPRLRRTAATLSVVFYSLLYLSLGSTEVVLFAGAVWVAQISCIEWPRFVLVVWPRACGWPLSLRVALDRYDFEHRTDWPRPPDPDAELEAWFDLRPVAGAKAIVELLLCFPVFYFALLAGAAAIHALLPRFVAVPLNSALAFALVGFSAYACLQAWFSRITRRPPPPAPDPTIDENKPAAAAVDSAADVTDIKAEIDTPPRPDR